MDDLKKLLYTEQIFDEYERRFAQARLNMKHRNPAKEEDRAEIKQAVTDILALDKIPQPEIKVLEEKNTVYDGINVRHMLFKSWERCYGEAMLLMPDGIKKGPLVIVCSGHGKHGVLTEGPQKMAFTLAKAGAFVLLQDNLGQGMREEFGHWDVIAPFYCGITLQGMIVSETMSWIRYMKKQTFVDTERIGVCGNSGGGMLTTFLAALEPSVTALASSGYPSEFSYLLQKERPHCACNILRHFASKLDMWEVLSTFAPKPIFLSSGVNDGLIPVEYFERMARKTCVSYAKAGAEDRFAYKVTNTLHSWENEDIYEISAFFIKVFGLKIFNKQQEYIMPIPTKELFELPSDNLCTDELAQQITGIKMPKGITLSDVFVPKYKGRVILKEDIIPDMGRGNLMRIFAQFEASL